MFESDKIYTFQSDYNTGLNSRSNDAFQILLYLFLVGNILFVKQIAYSASQQSNLSNNSSAISDRALKKKSILFPLSKMSASRQKPVGLFKTDEKTVGAKTYFIDKTGLLFEDMSLLDKTGLPMLISSIEKASYLLQCYNSLRGCLKPHALQITQLHLDSANRFFVTLSNDIQLVFRDAHPAIKLQGLLSAHPDLLTSDKVKKIDFRYPNGVALIV